MAMKCITDFPTWLGPSPGVSSSRPATTCWPDPVATCHRKNSVLAIELAWQTGGTAGVADAVVHAWLAELLTNPVWGVGQYAKLTEVKAILDIAELHRRAARGDMPMIADWDAADRAEIYDYWAPIITYNSVASIRLSGPRKI